MSEISKGLDVVRILKEVMNTLKQSMAGKFREMNLTGTQGMLTGTLAHHGKMKVSELSEKMGLTNSTVSGIIDRLEDRGFVERTRSTEDRRVVYVDLTHEFRNLSRNIFEEARSMFDEIINKASPEQLDIILKGLNTLKKLIEDHKMQATR